MAKKTGHGVTLKVDDDSNGSFTTVGQVRSLTPPSKSHTKVDATTLDDSVMYPIPGDPPEMGDVTVTVAFDPNLSTFQTVQTLHDNKTSCPWQVVFANYSTTKTWQFTAFVQNIAVGEAVSNTLLTAEITLCLQSDKTVS